MSGGAPVIDGSPSSGEEIYSDELVVYGQGVGGTGDLQVSTEDIRAQAALLRTLAGRLRTAAARARIAAYAMSPTASLTISGAAAVARAWDTVHGAEAQAVELDDLATRLESAATRYDGAETAALATVFDISGLRPSRAVVLMLPNSWLPFVLGIAAADAVRHGQDPWALTRGGAGMVLTEWIWFSWGLDNGVEDVATALARLVAVGVPTTATVQQVTADGTVYTAGRMPASHETISSLEGIVEAIDPLYPDRGTLPEGTVRIDKIVDAEGNASWLVLIPGTQGSLVSASNPLDWADNPAGMVGMPNAATSMVVAAMTAAGIKPGDPVFIGGHSQGGLAAMNAASEVEDLYDVEGVLTIGSPIGLLDAPDGAQVLALEHVEDPVPGLDATANPVNEDWTTVERDLCTTQYVPDADYSDWQDAHDLDTYADTAALADASDDAAILDFLAAVGSTLDEESTATTFYYQGTR